MSTMGIQRYDKLNHLHHVLPEGLPVTSSWLQRQGYSRQLVAKYFRHGWLASPVRGVYRRDSVMIDHQRWEPVVISLQRLLEVSVTVGGRTALELQGLSHNLSMAAQEVQLYVSETPPSWVIKIPLKQRFVFHSTNLFKTDDGRINRSKDYRQANFMDCKWGASEWTLRVSTPERAILELLNQLPTHESFHQADMLMEGLSNLRPNYLDTLLADCQSIKTKRLFLWFSQRHNHAWFQTLDTENVNIGKGKRMIVPGGKLDPKYLITVPEKFAND
jgi:hypothetical protein